MPKYKVCRLGKTYRDCKTFDSLEDIIKWANEEISKSKEIKVGDIVTIENFGQMYTTLDETFFEELWDNTDEVADRIKWKVVFIYGDRVFIERLDYPDRGLILCINKRGLEKFEEV